MKLFKKNKIAFSCFFILVLTSCFFVINGVAAATEVYYSVGQSSSDLKTGSPTINIVSGAVTFSVAQTGNIGVGDEIDYDTDNKKCYISAKTSTSVWSCTTATGQAPGDINEATVNSIKRAYTSLSEAESGAEDADHLNTLDLTSGDGYVLNFPCYYDSGADTDSMTISGWTTAADNYIRIYTPTSTISQVNNSQRHEGSWDDERYRLEVESPSSSIVSIESSFVKVDGLQIKITANSGSVITGIVFSGVYGDSQIDISNNIIQGVVSGTASYIMGISRGQKEEEINTVKAWNNVIYGFIGGNGDNYGIISFTGTIYAYNNTVYNCGCGYETFLGSLVVKNNIAYNNTVDYSGTFGSDSTHNLSKDETASTTIGLGVTYPNKTLSFINTDSGTENFSLKSTDTDAIDKGADLSADTDLILDIKGQTRSGSWDLGASEADVVVPTVVEVTSSNSDGNYIVDQIINVQVVFSENVFVTGTPKVKLQVTSEIQYAMYESGSGTETLDFSYTVQANDYSVDLDYADNSSLMLNSGTIKDIADNDATLTLSEPGESGSLGYDKDIILGPNYTETFKSTPEGDLKLDIYLPRDNAEKTPYPVILSVPGGFLGHRVYNRYRSYMINEGFAYISADYTVPDYDAGLNMPIQVNDAKDAIRWIKAHASDYGLDPEKIGAIGWSAGGYISQFLSTTNDDPFFDGDYSGINGTESDYDASIQALVSLAGISNYLSFGQLVDPSDQGLKLLDAIGCLPSECPETYTALSPIEYVSSDDAPVMLIHDVDDGSVNYSQSENMYNELLANSVPTELVTLEGAGGHFFPLFETEADDWAKSFFDKYLMQPVRSSSSPSGASINSNQTLSLFTDDQATCRYSTTSGTDYNSMTNVFSNTNSTFHSQSLSNLSPRDYTYYVRCVDSFGNANADDYLISFSIDSTGGGGVPSVASNIAIGNSSGGSSGVSVIVSPAQTGLAISYLDNKSFIKTQVKPQTIQGTYKLSIQAKDQSQVAQATKNASSPQGYESLSGLAADFKIISGGQNISKLNKPITIEIKYESKQVSQYNEDTLKIYYFNEEQQAWLPVESIVDKVRQIISAQVDHLTLFTVMAQSQGSLSDGDLVRNSNAAGSSQFDVYIIKKTNNKKYKRLILSPHVFESYEHFDKNQNKSPWDDIIEVNQTTLDNYETSQLVRQTGKEKVYQLETTQGSDTGQKRWLNITEEEFLANYDPDAVCTVNKTDLRSYQER